MFDLEYDDFGYDDGDDSSWRSNEELEQERWEQENNIETLLNNDPDYHKWSDRLDRQTAEEREIFALAEIEAERNFVSSPWD